MLPTNLLTFSAAGVGAAGTSFESIATATGTGSSTSITFSSIPATYQHLQIREMARGATTTSASGRITFNSDTGSNYVWHQLTGTGAAVSAAAQISQTSMVGGIYPGASFSSNMMGVSIIDIHDYSSTTKNTTIRVFTGNDVNNATDCRIIMRSGLYINTAAISSITITNGDGINYTTTSTFALYGIKGA